MHSGMLKEPSHFQCRVLLIARDYFLPILMSERASKGGWGILFTCIARVTA